VTIYSRRACHLCDVAKAAIAAAGCGGEYELEEVDIDQDPELRARYTNDVPVVAINGVPVFRYRVRPEEFARKVGLANRGMDVGPAIV
jgi:glutaredoxin